MPPRPKVVPQNNPSAPTASINMPKFAASCTFSGFAIKYDHRSLPGLATEKGVNTDHAACNGVASVT